MFKSADSVLPLFSWATEVSVFGQVRDFTMRTQYRASHLMISFIDSVVYILIEKLDDLECSPD